MVQENERKLEMLENKLVNTQQSKVSDKYKMVRECIVRVAVRITNSTLIFVEVLTQEKPS